MALYYYKKAPFKIRTETKKSHKKSPSIATLLDRFYYRVANKLTATKPVSFLIPLVFIISGLGILYGQMKPYAIHYLQSKFSDRLNQEIIPLVPESYQKIRAEYISDPGVRYFSHLLESEKRLEEISNFKGTFYLTIEKIQIYDAPVTANVDSTSEETYKDALSHSLAHFKGTMLPGHEGNILIYGHSAAGDYADKHPEDLVTAFTRLFKLNIGDKMSIEIQGKKINYVVKKIKEVNPDDIQILNSNTSGKYLTLMTCSPPGLNSNRLIVVAIQQ